MEQLFVDRMRGRLYEIEAEQKELLDSLEAGFDRSLTESVGEISSIDQFTGDLGNETFEREKDLGFIAQARNTIRQCADALDKMEQGTYGECETCGQQIAMARLDALPFASKCIVCQEAADADRAPWSPPEEDFLSPPFQPISYGEEGIDRDDAWEIVARHGTSNTPQDTPEMYDDDDDHIDKGPYGAP